MVLRRALAAALFLACLPAQVIEFESGGLHYLTQTRNSVTVMFAQLPTHIREYAILQVAISNGSSRTWNFRPQDFKFRKADGASMEGLPASQVVQEFMKRGGRDDVIKLVTTYEGALYGVTRPKSTNGYEVRRQQVMAEVQSTRLKAAAAASAIVMVPSKLKPGESTDGAVFYLNNGHPLSNGKLVVEGGGTVFEFEVQK